MVQKEAKQQVPQSLQHSHKPVDHSLVNVSSDSACKNLINKNNQFIQSNKSQTIFAHNFG